MGKYRQFIKYYQSFHPIVWTLLGGTIIMRIVQFMSLPFLTIILVTEIKVDLVTAGFTVGLSALTGTIGGFIGGNLSDRFGRKWIAVGSLFLGGLSFAGIAIADSAWQFMLLNGLIGLFRTFFETTARALMADFTIQEKRFRVFALRYWAINVGVSIGPLLGA
ncbi:MFS transporter, partial [Bacillus sp. B-TM1]